MAGTVATIVAILREQSEDRTNFRRSPEVKRTQKNQSCSPDEIVNLWIKQHWRPVLRQSLLIYKTINSLSVLRVQFKLNFLSVVMNILTDQLNEAHDVSTGILQQSSPWRNPHNAASMLLPGHLFQNQTRCLLLSSKLTMASSTFRVKYKLLKYGRKKIFSLALPISLSHLLQF